MSKTWNQEKIDLVNDQIDRISQFIRKTSFENFDSQYRYEVGLDRLEKLGQKFNLNDAPSEIKSSYKLLCQNIKIYIKASEEIKDLKMASISLKVEMAVNEKQLKEIEIKEANVKQLYNLLYNIMHNKPLSHKEAFSVEDIPDNFFNIYGRLANEYIIAPMIIQDILDGDANHHSLASAYQIGQKYVADRWRDSKLPNCPKTSRPKKSEARMAKYQKELQKELNKK